MIVPSPATVTTVGNGTLTAAQLLGQFITRSGPTGAFADTTDTAANIYAALPGLPVGTTWLLRYNNTTAYVGTFTGGTGVTVSGSAAIPATSVATILFTLTAGGLVTAQVLFRNATD